MRRRTILRLSIDCKAVIFSERRGVRPLPKIDDIDTTKKQRGIRCIQTRIEGFLMGTLMLLQGNLKGLGVEARCEVLARKLSTDAGSRQLQRTYTYTDCSVIGAPADLPAGEYIVYFDGHSFSVANQRGLWFSRGPATKIKELRPALVA
jgi:hypothetical protein